MPSDHSNGWKTPLLGALFVLLTSISAYAWASTVDRIRVIEQNGSPASRERMIRIEVELQFLRETVIEMNQKLDLANEQLRGLHR
jgi:hypothetical protein